MAKLRIPRISHVTSLLACAGAAICYQGQQNGATGYAVSTVVYIAYEGTLPESLSQALKDNNLKQIETLASQFGLVQVRQDGAQYLFPKGFRATDRYEAISAAWVKMKGYIGIDSAPIGHLASKSKDWAACLDKARRALGKDDGLIGNEVPACLSWDIGLKIEQGKCQWLVWIPYEAVRTKTWLASKSIDGLMASAMPSQKNLNVYASSSSEGISMLLAVNNFFSFLGKEIDASRRPWRNAYYLDSQNIRKVFASNAKITEDGVAVSYSELPVWFRKICALALKKAGSAPEPDSKTKVSFYDAVPVCAINSLSDGKRAFRVRIETLLSL